MQLDDDNFIFKAALDFINQTNRHVFLTGKAGTGKTTFLKHIKEHSLKKMAIVAPTGVAAINAGGVTIHSFFQIPPGTFLPTFSSRFSSLDSKVYNAHSLLKNQRMNSDKRDLLKELDLLVIDEVSMVRADLLDAIDAVLKHVRRQHRQPFGGVQVLYIGDLFQLPPVAKNEEWNVLQEFYKSPFFFDATVMQQAKPVLIELKKIYRQKDEVFINVLNNVRNNCCTEKDLEILHHHHQAEFQRHEDDHFITLTTHNEKADAINRRELQRLPGESFSFPAEIKGEFNERMFPAENTLVLKPGAQVMFIRNDTGEDRRYYNGKIGTVESIDKEKIKIRFSNESELLEIKKETWSNIKYTYNNGKDSIDELELGTFRQYPLRLAWAITIHKSQGLTFDRAVIDAGASFAPGQVYVALSRLTSLEGMVLLTRIHPQAIQTDQRVLEFAREEMDHASLQEILALEQQHYLKKLLIDSFGWENMMNELQSQHDTYKEYDLDDFKPAMHLLKKIIDMLNPMQSTAEKFQRQLKQIFETESIDKLIIFMQRVAAAFDYYEKEIDKIVNQILQKSQNDYGKGFMQRLLLPVVDLFEKKKIQIKRVVQIASEMNQTDFNIQWAVRLYHMPVVLENRAATYQNKPKKQKKEKKIKGESKRISLELFRTGKSIQEIATERKLSPITIETHLADFIPTGEVGIHELIALEKLEKIENAIDAENEPTTTSVKLKLGDDYSYNEVRMVLKWKEAQQMDYTDKDG